MSLLEIWFPSDIASQQAQLLANATSTNVLVQSCTALDSATSSAWGTFYQSVQAFCALEPVWAFPIWHNEVYTSGSLADELQSYQVQLVAWQQKLSAKCTSIVQTPPPGGLPNATVSAWTPAIKYAAIAAGFVGTAYAIGKLVEALEIFKGAASAKA